MGSETRTCPCGRSGPMQATRLEAHGAFTVLVPRVHPPQKGMEILTLPHVAKLPLFWALERNMDGMSSHS
eukprot:6089312-Prorocentrum_lima.AAC.1